MMTGMIAADSKHAGMMKLGKAKATVDVELRRLAGRRTVFIFYNQEYPCTVEDCAKRKEGEPCTCGWLMGTEVDAKRINDTLKEFGYSDIRLRADKTTAQMQTELEDFGAADQSQLDAAIFFFIGHGDVVNGVEEVGKLLDSTFVASAPVGQDPSRCPIKDLTGLLSGKKDNLTGKNKLFFFICCRGSNVNAVPTRPKMKTDGVYGERATRERMLPAGADVLDVRCVTEGSPGFTYTDCGNYVVESICENIRKDRERVVRDNTLATPVQMLLQTVADEVSRLREWDGGMALEGEPIGPDSLSFTFQIPEYKSTLRKTFCF